MGLGTGIEWHKQQFNRFSTSLDPLFHYEMSLTLWHFSFSVWQVWQLWQLWQLATRVSSFSQKPSIFGYNHSTFWQNQHKSPYRCSGYLQLPRSFGVRNENPAANKSNERIRRTKAHQNACRQKRLRLQDIYLILQKGVKAQRFHTFFRSHSACHSHLIFTQKTQTETIRDIQRNLEIFRDGHSNFDCRSGFVM